MANDKSGETDLVPLTLRIPRDVHGKLKALSEAEFRSLNHQIIMALSYFLEVQEKFNGLPHPEAMRKAMPAATYLPWLKAAAGASSRAAK